MGERTLFPTPYSPFPTPHLHRYLNRLPLALQDRVSHQSAESHPDQIALQIVGRVVGSVNAHPRRRPHILVVPQLDDLVKAGEGEHYRHGEERYESQWQTMAEIIQACAQEPDDRWRDQGGHGGVRESVILKVWEFRFVHTDRAAKSQIADAIERN